MSLDNEDKGLTYEELMALPESEPSPTGLTYEELMAIPDSPLPADQRQERVDRALEMTGAIPAFVRGITDMLGGKTLPNRSPDEQAKYEQQSQTIQQEHPVAYGLGNITGFAAPGSIAGKTSGLVNKGVAKTLSKVAPNVVKKSVPRALGRIAGDALTGGAIGGLYEPYRTFVMGEPLPTVPEIQQDALVSAGIGGGLGMFGELVKGGSTFARRNLQSSAYRNKSLPRTYGENIGTGSRGSKLKSDLDTMQKVKQGLSELEEPARVELNKVLGESPFLNTSLLNAGATPVNQRQAAVSYGLASAMSTRHPNTASQFSNKYVEPQVKSAKKAVQEVMDSRTNRVGTPAHLSTLEKVYNQRYDEIAKKARNVSFTENELKTLLSSTPFVTITQTDNVVNALTNFNSANPMTKGKGVIPAVTVLNYMRNLPKDAITYDTYAGLFEAFDRALAKKGIEGFGDAYRGWRMYFATKDAFARGKTAMGRSNAADIASELSPLARSPLSSDIEKMATTSGFLSNIERMIDKDKPITLSSSAKEVLKNYPGLSSAVESYNYWRGLKDILSDKGLTIDTAKAPRSIITDAAKKVAWGWPATLAASIENAFKHGVKGADRKAAESIARVLTEPKRNLMNLMENTRYNNQLLDFLMNRLPAVGAATYGAVKERDGNE